MQAQERQGCATCCLLDDGCANFCEALTASGGSLETRSAVMATIQARHLRHARAHLAAIVGDGAEVRRSQSDYAAIAAACVFNSNSTGLT